MTPLPPPIDERLLDAKYESIQFFLKKFNLCYETRDSRNPLKKRQVKLCGASLPRAGVPAGTDEGHRDGLAVKEPEARIWWRSRTTEIEDETGCKN